jgi:predicted alpha/beta superfamily hydrolase
MYRNEQPYINEQHPTNRSDRIIYGQSLDGAIFRDVIFVEYGKQPQNIKFSSKSWYYSQISIDYPDRYYIVAI